MTKDFTETAMQIQAKLQCGQAKPIQGAGESAQLSHAVARVLRNLSRHQAARCGEDLLELIDQHLSGASLASVADKSKPTLAELRQIANRLARRRLRKTDIDRRLGWLCQELGFDEVDFAILGIFARWTLFDSWRELVRKAPLPCSNPDIAMLAKLSGLPLSMIDQRLMPGSRLLRSELVCDDHDGEFRVASLFKRIIRTHVESPEDLVRWLLPDAESTALEWQDFEHLGPMRELAEAVMASRKPVSILLFGEPGTGKTEFSRALAQRVGCGATFAGLTDESGNEPDRSERLSHLMLLRALCARKGSRIIVVDEADDVLALGRQKGASKQWVNRLIEDPQVPTIWILNDQSNLDRAALRRMTLAIGFDRPPLSVRQRIARRAAESQNVVLTEAETHALAALPANPAVVASGLRAACLAGGGADLAQRAITSVIKAMGQSPHPERKCETVYDPALSSADTNLADLARRLESSPAGGWSLLLSGPSGTGKSAFARHLAERLGIEVEERRGSDLLSPFVGETEANIAAAFARAADRGTMLLIDEADSFLFRREAGQRSWEVGLVNEMLRQMEHLRVPFVATTNLVDHLDPAVQRRFTLRVGFRTMTEAQAVRLFRAHWGQDWPQGVSVHVGQTPGDFGVVAHRAALLGETRPVVLLRWLREEIEARGGVTGRPVGFHLPEPVVTSMEHNAA